MRNRFGSSLQIGIADTGVTLSRTHGWLRPRMAPLASTAPSDAIPMTPDRAVSVLRDMCTQTPCAGLSTTVIVADNWVRYFIVTPPRNTARLQDCQAAAAMRFQALYGEPAADWQLDAHWDARQPFLACAMPQGLLVALRQAAADHALKLIQIVPHFVAAWNQWSNGVRADAWFGAVQGGTLTLGIIDRQRLCAVQALVPGDAPTWLAHHVKREALRLNVSMPRQMQLCGEVPRAWLERTTDDFACTQLGVPPVSATLPASKNGGLQ